MSNTACPQCGFSNDPTRVFCQNCGSRLPVGAPSAGKLFIPPDQQAPPGVRKPIKPVTVAGEDRNKTRPARRGSLLRSVVSLVLTSACLAALVQMMRAPDNIPGPLSYGNDAQAEYLYSNIIACANNTSPRSLAITGPQANNFLVEKIMPATDPTRTALGAQYVRSFVILGQKEYRFYMEQRLFNWPFYVYITQGPNPQGGIESRGGGVGRLPVHPLLSPLLERVLQPLLVNAGLAEPLSKVATVDVTPAQAIVVWKGSAKPTQP